MSKKNLDSYDKRILYELDKNARITTTKIGKKIRKSKQFVDYRIAKLEKNKVLGKYVTVIDYSKLGYTSIRLYFKFYNITPEKQKEIGEDLIKDKNLWWFVDVEGRWDVAYAILVKNILNFYDYFDEIMKKYGMYIGKRSIVIYTHVLQFPKSYLIKKENEEPGTLVGASREIIDCSSFDMKLLKALSDKAKLSLLELAKMLDSSPNVIKSHMRKLESQKIILGYKALIDVSFLGYRYFKAYIKFAHSEKLRELHEYCKRHPNILNLNKTIGGEDFEIELQVRNFEEFEKIMNDIRIEFKGMIGKYEFVIAKEERKMNYFPLE